MIKLTLKVELSYQQVLHTVAALIVLFFRR
jgi:hypothetical protein